MIEHEPLRDAEHVGKLLMIPPKTVLQYARDGRLPCIRIGKHVRFRVSEIETAISPVR
jgi:excisionase family DNA binding protein